ncbi:MAG: DNA-binding protein [Thermomicrobiales bacterium]
MVETLTEQAQHELSEAIERLHALGTEITESEMVMQIAATLREMIGSSGESGDGSDLTEAEKELLREGGFDLSPPPPGAPNPFLRTAAKFVTLIETAYTTKEAAALLGINESRVRQRCGERTLYGVKWRGGWRLPRFQFFEGRVIPFAERVLPHFPADLDLIAVYNWFTYPNDDLRDDRYREMSPREWLIGGRDYAPVAELAAGL